MPSDVPGVLRALSACRSSMIAVHTHVRVHGPVYHAASMVIAAIDAFATLLTGQRYYFSIGGTTGSSSIGDQAPRDQSDNGR